MLIFDAFGPPSTRLGREIQLNITNEKKPSKRARMPNGGGADNDLCLRKIETKVRVH